MMLVGTSLGGCLKSIALGEVSVDDVLVIIARTDCRSIEDLLEVVETYHRDGNTYSRSPEQYQWSGIDLARVQNIAVGLWHHGKIHQPKTFNGYNGFVHVEMARGEVWIPLAPSPKTDDDRVVNAYEKYLITRNLLQ